MALSEAAQCLSAASLRHQLAPGRFRHLDPPSRLLLAYMLDAREWVEPWESRVVGAAVMPDGVLALAFARGQVTFIKDGREWLDRLVADVVARAELDGSEDADHLASWPHVRDNRL